ncbi:uncharacterized protein HD556DRAFT_1198969, partial [Suillus plorans]
LPSLADYARILTQLTMKAADHAFQAIKDLVTSPQCLTTIDHDNLGNNKIFVMCDTSDFQTGAV